MALEAEAAVAPYGMAVLDMYRGHGAQTDRDLAARGFARLDLGPAEPPSVLDVAWHARREHRLC
eukprot:1738714-Rhodomonas_salina.1